MPEPHEGAPGRDACHIHEDRGTDEHRAPRDGGMTRREFHLRAARTAAGLLLAAASTTALAQEAPMNASPETPEAPAPPRPAVPDEILAQVRAAAPHLPKDDDEELRAQVKSTLDLAKALRGLAVPDGVEPDFIYTAKGGTA